MVRSDGASSFSELDELPPCVGSPKWNASFLFYERAPRMDVWRGAAAPARRVFRLASLARTRDERRLRPGPKPERKARANEKPKAKRARVSTQKADTNFRAPFVSARSFSRSFSRSLWPGLSALTRFSLLASPPPPPPLPPPILIIIINYICYPDIYI